MSEKFTEFGLSADSYAAFDATSLRDLIKQRLLDKGVFTDQLFEGSNLSSLVDVIAYSYHTLLFYLNRTSSETIFTEAQLYENVNRIVKLLNYNPTGYKTAVTGFQADANSNLPVGLYTIPRYSFVDVGGIKYSLVADASFGKTLSTDQTITSLGDNHLLYQGAFEQYPDQEATGEEFEAITLTLDDEIKVDTHNIHVYVKSNNVWSQYQQTESLFLESPVAKAFEKRLNEHKLFEIRFGNGIYGKKLTAGDRIVIFYLKSDQDAGVIGPGTINGQFTPLTTNTFLEIRDGVKSANTVYMSISNLQSLTLTNPDPSTKPQQEETVDQIKTFAPGYFAMQNRLITANDFDSYIKKQYGNIILDVKTINNNEYLDGHLAYVVNTLKLTQPNMESRVSYNQVNFATSTNFNNVYIYAVPRFEKITSTTPMVNFLSPAQRSLIINGVRSMKSLTAEPVVVDPVYMAMDLGVATPSDTLTPQLRDTTRLNIVRSRDSQRDADTIKEEVISIINSYFGTSSRLGHTLDITSMNTDISSLPDVVDVYMTRTDNTTINTQGITFVCWNPVYESQDITIISQNTTFPYFKFPYLIDTSTLSDRIDVTTSSTS